MLQAVLILNRSLSLAVSATGASKVIDRLCVTVSLGTVGFYDG